MSLTVIKPGILDTVQDLGRFGYQYLGVNPGGAMDSYSVQIVNILVGNDPGEAVIEMYFPAAAFLFQKETMIAVGGADFIPCINGEEIPLWHPVIVSHNSVLQFKHMRKGAECYLAIRGGLDIPEWLDSYSTNIKAGHGGFKGRALQKNDIIEFRTQHYFQKKLAGKEYNVLPWHADIEWNIFPPDKFFVIAGNEWNWLEKNMKERLLNNSFTVSLVSDKMGFRLNGIPLYAANQTEIVSAAVSFGTIQLLPDGQLIVLMSDHQTTGGYPRIAHVIHSHLHRLAQARPGDRISFEMVENNQAEDLLCQQKNHLRQLQYACSSRLEEFLNTD